MGYLPEDWIEKRQLELQEKQASANDTNQDIQAMQLQEQTVNLVKEQLDLSEQLDTIEHLLKGHVLGFVKIEGAEVQKWVEPDNPDMIVLTEYGVHLIMNTITFYLNKNTLLSNYEDDMILQKMKDFSHALNRIIYLKMEKVFVQPTNEDCIEILQERIKKKTELRKFAYQLVGREFNEEDIREEFIEEIEKNIEKEIGKIRDRVIEEKLKQYEIIIREVQDAVHSTYLRAWKGQERRTLREHIHTTESLGTGLPPMQRQPRERGSLNPMRLFRRG